MSAKIYVGNLSWNTDDDSLRQVFSQFGSVLDCIVMRDRETGRSRGFGFVTYGSSQEAESALGMNDQDLDGRRVKVNLANAKPAGGGGGGGGYDGGYNRGGGGGGYGRGGGGGGQGGYGGGGYGGGGGSYGSGGGGYGGQRGYQQGGYGGGSQGSYGGQGGYAAGGEQY